MRKISMIFICAIIASSSITDSSWFNVLLTPQNIRKHLDTYTKRLPKSPKRNQYPSNNEKTSLLATTETMENFSAGNAFVISA